MVKDRMRWKGIVFGCRLKIRKEKGWEGNEREKNFPECARVGAKRQLQTTFVAKVFMREFLIMVISHFVVK